MWSLVLQNHNFIMDVNVGKADDFIIDRFNEKGTGHCTVKVVKLEYGPWSPCQFGGLRDEKFFKFVAFLFFLLGVRINIVTI
jgi:hypothetical protein